MSKKTINENDAIQNNLFSLLSSLSDVFRKNSFETNESLSLVIKRLTSITDQNEINCLLVVFKELQELKVTKYNLAFIINNSNLLKNLFFKNGKISKENLKCLIPPYDILLRNSYIFAKYCEEINLVHFITTEEFNEIVYIINTSQPYMINTLEAYITYSEDKLNLKNIAQSTELFFDLYKVYNEIFGKLILNILITTACNIFDITSAENALNDTYSYIYAIKQMDEASLYNMTYFLHNIDYNLDKIYNLLTQQKFWSCEIFKLENKNEIIQDMIDSKNEYYPLLLKSPNLALKFYLHEKETGEKTNFNLLNNIQPEIYNELEKIL